MRAPAPPRPRMKVRSPLAAPRRRWIRSRRSKSFGEACLLEWMRVVRAGHLAAETRRGKHFSRIAEAFRVERAAHGEHHVEIVVREHLRHVLGLVRADSVLARERAARVDAVLEDFAAHFGGELGLARDLLVVADERMQVAVARMKDVADADRKSTRLNSSHGYISYAV